jgi:hypothetical protein
MGGMRRRSPLGGWEASKEAKRGRKFYLLRSEAGSLQKRRA